MNLRGGIPLFGICVLVAAAGIFSQPQTVSAERIAMLSAGTLHTCAVTTEGGVKCWGLNRFGQLGNGTTVDSSIPVDVVGLESGVIAVSAGGTYTCALTAAGGVKCWGQNSDGQLGNGTSWPDDVETTPVDVVALSSGVAAVSAGFNHTCALTAGGGAMCWGSNVVGQLGTETAEQCGEFPDPCSEIPVEVTGLGSGVAAVAAGEFYSCAVTMEGGAKCWGNNGFGQLGDGTTTDRMVPVPVAGLSDAEAIAPGAAHTCALTTAGGVKCWGSNFWGQVGNGTYDIYGFAGVTDVVGLGSDVSAVNTGLAHTCALINGGGVTCWGQNFVGQLGRETEETCVSAVSCSTIPLDVPGLSGIEAISAAFNGFHTCAVTAIGGVRCWGADMYGQLGDSDGDGCTDLAEDGDDPMLGGQRDLLSFWDFFDTPTGEALDRDGAVSGVDFFAVLGRFQATDDGPGDFDRYSDPLSTPNAATGDPRANYHPAYDRTSPGAGEDPWDTGGPDGAISGLDFFALLAQFGHQCG